jgi:peptidoglycan/xylan/chitin deacetylase (PgdA/CDA1 family)
MFWDRPHIIMLHHVSDLLEFKSLEPYSISNSKFSELLDYIEKNNFTTINFYDIKNGIRTTKEVVITFDDCSRELLNFAIPELIKRNMKAVFYIPTGYINSFNQWDVNEGKDQVNFFNEQEIIEISKHSNFEIGSHSVTHRKLNQLNENEILKELIHSKKEIERIIKKDVISFAHPFGEIPLGNQKLLEKAGYLFACGIYVKRQNNFALRRFIYHNGDNTVSLERKFSFVYGCYRFLIDKIT